jgi:hypothetical protein
MPESQHGTKTKAFAQSLLANGTIKPRQIPFQFILFTRRPINRRYRASDTDCVVKETKHKT